MREAKLGCDLMPASKNLNEALGRLGDLAQVYTMVVWHEQFLRTASRGQDLVPLEG